jgi:hypothetical protein
VKERRHSIIFVGVLQLISASIGMPETYEGGILFMLYLIIIFTFNNITMLKPDILRLTFDLLQDQLNPLENLKIILMKIFLRLVQSFETPITISRLKATEYKKLVSIKTKKSL